MKLELLEDILELVDARIDEKIQDAFGRDELNEMIRFGAMKDDFIKKWCKEK